MPWQRCGRPGAISRRLPTCSKNAACTTRPIICNGRGSEEHADPSPGAYWQSRIVRPCRMLPTPMPGPRSDGDELAGDKDLERREPKLRYDGDCEDQD